MFEVKEGRYYRSVHGRIFGPIRIAKPVEDPDSFADGFIYSDNVTNNNQDDRVYWRSDGKCTDSPNEDLELVCEVKITDVNSSDKKRVPNQAPLSIRQKRRH